MEQGLSLEVIKGKITLQAQAANLQKLLQAGENIQFTTENINEPCEVLDKLIDIAKNIDAVENPFTKDWKNFNNAKSSLYNPLNELITRKRNEKGKIAQKIKNELFEAAKKTAEIQTIKNKIQSTTLSFSTSIGAANSLDELIRIERLINLEKTREDTYKDFLPTLIIALNELTPLVSLQKNNLKELSKLDEQKKEAEKNGNDAEILTLMDKSESIQNKIEQNQTTVQLTAINSATKNETVESESTVLLPKSRRTSWEYEIKDVKALAKLYPEFVYIEINHKAIKDWLKEEKENKTICEYENGALKIFQKSIY